MEVTAVSAYVVLRQGSSQISAGSGDVSEREERYVMNFKDGLSIGAMETGGLTEREK